MPTYFLADLHLEADKPHLTEIFVRFLREHRGNASGIYLLGDIFEVWIGDDDPSPLVTRIAHEIRSTVDAGTAVYFMHGNRDFLLGEAFAERAGMILIPDPTVVTVGGRRIVLSHGDRYCTDDLAYQSFRAKSRDPQWQKKVLGWPLWRRRLTARVARFLSKRNYRKKLAAGGDPNQISDVVEADVLAEFLELDVEHMIHGHTHRPDLHALKVADKAYERLVLADWRERGEALRIEPDGNRERLVLT